MGTIVQEYGPIYGEAVNGTVSGRPNGSVYVPYMNTITIQASFGVTPTTLSLVGTDLKVDQWVGANAVAQDLSSYIVWEVYSDSALTTQFGTGVILIAGYFNDPVRATISSGSTAPTTGADYYLVAKLYNNGVAVATSNIIQLVGA